MIRIGVFEVIVIASFASGGILYFLDAIEVLHSDQIRTLVCAPAVVTIACRLAKGQPLFVYHGKYKLTR